MSMDRRKFMGAAAATVVAGGAALPSVFAQGGVFRQTAILGQAGELVVEKYPYKWYASLDGGDVYNEGFSSRAEAVKYAYENGGAIIAECKRQPWHIQVDGDSVLELLHGQNEDLCNEDGETIECTSEQVTDLGKMVSAAIEEWATKHKIDMEAWVFGDVRNKELIGFTPDPTDDEDPLYLAQEQFPAKDRG